MASSIAKRQTGLSAPQFGNIAANVDMLNKAQVETYLDNLCSDINSAVDTLTDATAAKVASVTAGDDSITVSGTATTPTVAVQISAATGNVLELDETAGQKGLKVILPTAAEYTVVKASTAESGFAASYNLQKDGVNVGATINIPKDMVVSSGTVETKSAAGDWGAAGTYLVLTLANATNDKVYINVGDLIEYVTSGSTSSSQIIVSIDSDHKVTATIGAGKVGTTELADDCVTTAKLADSINADIENGLAGIPVFSASASYSAGDLVRYNGATYRFTASKAAGDWDSTKVEAKTVQALLAEKVDKVAGKQLSTEDFTTSLKTKLEGIATGAEVNVQADWSVTDMDSDAYIANKPTLGALAAKSSVGTTDLDSTLSTCYNDYNAKLTAVAAVTIPGENDVTLRSLRTAVAALQTALAATAS